MLTLDAILKGPSHVVAEVVKTKFIICSVGDIRGVGLATLCGGHAGENDTNTKSKEAVDATHPLAIALCEIVVGGNYMNALASESVEICGKG